MFGHPNEDLMTDEMTVITLATSCGDVKRSRPCRSRYSGEENLATVRKVPSPL